MQGLWISGTKHPMNIRRLILGAKTVCVNGPMGIFEEEITEYGTKMVWEALAKTEGYTLIGGGDSVTATGKI